MQGEPVEVFFPNEFRHALPPYDIIRDWKDVYAGELQRDVENVRVPILKLAHITHSHEAESISRVSTYEFRVRPKLGNPGTGSYMWNIDHFDLVDHKTPLLKGCYSWWTPYTHDYNLPDGHLHEEYCISPANIKNKVLERNKVNAGVADFLKYPSESIYGNHILHCNFVDLLNAYATSRNNGELYMKIGGTLRYRTESCYVLIICTDSDQDLSDIPPFGTKNYYFESNGLTNDKGKVINHHAIANFHPRNIIQSVGEETYCTAEAAFVFYYPDQALVVEHTKCEQATVDTHPDDICLRRFMGKCPNQS